MRLLLHICCGPCTIYPTKLLLGRKFKEVRGFFYNPNIHPPSEYKRRRDSLKDASLRLGISVICPPYKMEEYFRAVFSKEDSPQRCRHCWELRLSETASFAKKEHYDAFTSTLLVSPYQNQAILKDIGEKVAAERGIEFYYEDFRKGFKESQEEAKKEDLYRQKYCGCVFSELERVKV